MTVPPSTGPRGWRQYSNEVTMPKFPPPPRSPHRRSLLQFLLALRKRPSAVTTSADKRLSHVRPCFPRSQPIPPPSVSPAIPVDETIPPGVASPCACVS